MRELSVEKIANYLAVKASLFIKHPSTLKIVMVAIDTKQAHKGCACFVPQRYKEAYYPA